MYTYRLGVLVNNTVRQLLSLEAASLSQARQMWAERSDVLHSADWDPGRASLSGHPLVCIATSDPAIEVVHLPAPPPANKPIAPPASTAPAEAGESIVLTPPQEIPAFTFREDWKDDAPESPDQPAGFGDDKPL